MNGCIAGICVDFPNFLGLGVCYRDKMIFESGTVIGRYPAYQNSITFGWDHPQNRVARGIKTVFSEPNLKMEMWPGGVPCAAHFPNYRAGVYPLTDSHINFLHVGIDGIKLLILITEVMPDGNSNTIRILKVVG